MGVCLRYAKSREEAEDFLQEGFVKIFNSLKQYHGSGSFEGWMRKIIVNTALEAMRKKTVMFSETDVNELIEEPSDDASLNDLNAQELVHQIQKLPPGYRMVFNLYAVEGYSHREIADQLGISEGTSRSQYAKARKQLQLMISKIEYQILSNAR
jgi:RNA polymerase sigma-70 factor (ECF subfamily)